MGASSSYNPMGHHGLLWDSFTFYLMYTGIRFRDSRVLLARWIPLRIPSLKCISSRLTGDFRTGSCFGCVQQLLYIRSIWLVQVTSKLRISDTFLAPSKWAVDSIRGEKQDIMPHQFINLYTQASSNILIPQICPTLTSLAARWRCVKPISWFKFTNGEPLPFYYLLCIWSLTFTKI
jgi:hypothetical protein